MTKNDQKTTFQKCTFCHKSVLSPKVLIWHRIWGFCTKNALAPNGPKPNIFSLALCTLRNAKKTSPFLWPFWKGLFCKKSRKKVIFLELQRFQRIPQKTSSEKIRKKCLFSKTGSKSCFLFFKFRLMGPPKRSCENLTHP